MLIGIRLSELSRRSKALLAVSIVLLAAGIATLAWPPVNAAWPLAVWLLAVIALGLYWLSFLLDFRSRLTPPQRPRSPCCRGCWCWRWWSRTCCSPSPRRRRPER